MSLYSTHADLSNTPQTEKARKDQVPNNGGGFSFALDCWKQLDRFLILGQVGNAYHASEKEVVKDNILCLNECLALDGLKTIARIVEVSESGRPPKNDQAIFCLSQAAGSLIPEVRRAALQAMPRVCRIGTHLFSFISDIDQSAARGWGRGLRNAVASWYSDKSPQDLAHQVMKYQQRNGWSNRDLLRLSHAFPKTPEMNATFRWICGGKEAVVDATKKGGDLSAHLPELLSVYDEVQRTEDEKELIRLISAHNLPREVLPTRWLNSVDVWAALLPHMGLTAMIRNLGKMTAVGLIKPLSNGSKFVQSALVDHDKIKKNRIHPIQYLLASGIYGQGKGDKGSLTWEKVNGVMEALDEGFHRSFATLVPTGLNTLLAIDVSGSMGWGEIAGCPGITPAIASAAMAMITLRTEDNCDIVAFSGELIPVDISKKDSLSVVRSKLAKIKMGSTDCSAPMTYASKKKLGVDVFQIYTDSDTNGNGIHPYQALKNYRKDSGRESKLCVVGMQATNISIADPKDSGMLDVCGFDSAAPQLMADWARGAF